MSPAVVVADDSTPKAIVALTGDPDRFNIGQDGYCGKRTEIETPANARFRIPSNAKTFFFVRTTFKAPTGTYYCEGDFSFVPDPGKLHVIRYTLEGSQCKLEVLSTLPGSTPQPYAFEREPRQSCLVP